MIYKSFVPFQLLLPYEPFEPFKLFVNKTHQSYGTNDLNGSYGSSVIVQMISMITCFK
jgi:hypothetical protein